MIFISHSAAETEAVGRDLARMLEESGRDRAFIAFRGEMGVGKTAFTRGFASHFGITGVKSPTYTIVNEYAGRVRIFHFDMYRIEDSSDLASIGYDDYVRARGYCIAEWSENVEEDLPEDTVTVTISRLPSGDDDRQIEILGV
ncbi:MAG: tRNA (adenosine(37)-N6)-threonylcarbamoyltransferase complex ATPase subunit type 1 TsaE [Clostridia bacterium]|nr:tRNA (adenosine(37)-N6)-threonylcarbamoyltransferase complex ATPase subunit type 1 TsaE [Clostridia bacterium]